MARMTNGRWTFTDPSNDIVGITVSNGSAISSNSFEIAQIATSSSRALDLGHDAARLRGPRLRRISPGKEELSSVR